MEDELRTALEKAEPAPQHAFKYTEFQADPASTHSKIVSLVPPATRVLEFGCATGYMSEVLKDRLGCTVVGIEIDHGAAALAEQHAERVIVGDAEKIDYAAELAGEEFDVLLFADVLERVGVLLERGKNRSRREAEHAGIPCVPTRGQICDGVGQRRFLDESAHSKSIGYA